MTGCFECGHAPAATPVGDHWLCQSCAADVRDVVALAAALQMPLYDLAAAVIE